MSARAVLDSTAASWSNSSTRVRSLLVVIAGALLIAIPFLVFGVPSNRDLTNHFRFTLPFYDSIVSGNLYPGWLAESNSGYGDPSFRFYPPGLYYLLSAFRFVMGEWYVATLLTFATITVISCLGVYFWAKPILSERTAVCVGLLYAIAPYHVNQLYQATLLAEWAGSAILPFVFAFTDRVCAHGRRRDIAGLAASFALLVLTHLPLAVIGSIAVLVYALVRIERGRWIESVMKLGAGAAIGLCASAVYWVTMVSEMRWIGINDVHYDASVDFRRNFVLSTFSPDNLNVWWMNILGLATLLLFIPAFLLLRRDSTNRGRSLRAVVVLTLLSVFMSLPLSRPIWSLLSPLQQTQFPWRWFAILSMAGSLLAAAALPLVFRLKREYRILVLGAMAISAGFTLTHIVREAQYLNRQKFETALQDVRGTHSVDYWLPIWASQKPLAMSNDVEATGRQVSISSWGSQSRSFSVGEGAAAEARVRTFYYPHWTATSNGHRLTTHPDNDGALLISLPKEAAQVELRFVEPTRSRLSSAVSLAGLLLIGGLALPFPRGNVRQASACRSPQTTLPGRIDKLKFVGHWERCETERQQQEHYDVIAADYEAHYSDEWSAEYRKQFIYDPMFEGLDLAGMKVLDAMCGSGQTTEYLLARGANVTGLDISNEVIDTFRSRWTNVTAVKRSLLDSGLPDNSFDCIAIVGGLHHIHPNVTRAMTELHRILKPGGHLCFMEPHTGSLPDVIRRVWYKFDHYFSDNEAAIDVTRLQRDFHDQFQLKHVKYLGNVAFLLVLNSLIFRIPQGLKKFYSPYAMKLESLIGALQSKTNSCFAVAQLQKRT